MNFGAAGYYQPTQPAGQQLWGVSYAPWTPREAAAPVLWLEPTARVTLAAGKVSSWVDDLNGSAAWTQATGANQPTYTTNGLNGLPVMTLVGANATSLKNPSLSLGQGTEFLLATTTLNNNANIISHQVPDGTANSHTVVWWQNSLALLIRAGGVNPSAGFVPYTLSSPAIISGIAVNSLASLWYNGTPQTITGSNSSTISSTAGGDYLGTGEVGFMTGYIAERFRLSGAASTSDRQKAEGFLAWKWQQQTNLVPGHPYKAAYPGLT